jgi:hypothetical protein
MFTHALLGKSYVCLNGKSFLGHLAPLVLVGPFQVDDVLLFAHNILHMFIHKSPFQALSNDS